MYTPLAGRFFAKPRRALLEALAGSGPVLDIGCGEGAFLRELRAAGGSGFGVDALPGGLARGSCPRGFFTNRPRKNSHRKCRTAR